MLKRAATRGALWGVVGQAVQLVCAFGALWFLARILDKTDFGLAALVLIVTGLVGAAADWGMQVLCVQQQGIDQARAESFALRTGALAAVLVVLASPLIAAVFSLGRAHWLLWQIGAWSLLFHGATAGPRARLARDLRFRELAQVDMAVALIVAAVSVSMARSFGALAIVIGDVAGAAAGTLLVWAMAGRAQRGGEPPSLRDGTRIVGTRLADAGFGYADRFLVGGLLGPAALGLYRFGLQHTLALLQRLNAVAEQIALPVFSRLQQDRAALIDAYLGLTRVWALVVVPVAVAGWGIAPWLVDFLYPDRWAEVVPVIRALCVAGACAGLNSHPGVVWLALGDTSLRLKWSLWNLVALAVLVPIGAYYGLTGVAYVLAARSLLATAVGQWITNRRAGVPTGAYVRALGPGLAFGAAAAALIAVAT